MKRNVVACFYKRFSFSLKEHTSYSEFIKQTTGLNIPENFAKETLSQSLENAEDKFYNIVKEKTKFKGLDNLPLMDEILREDPFGSVEMFEHRGKTVCIIGMAYGNIPTPNIWKILSSFKPDNIMVEIYPDDFNKSFGLNKRNPRTEDLSSRLYFDQLDIAKYTLNGKVEKEVFEKLPTYYEDLFIVKKKNPLDQ